MEPEYLGKGSVKSDREESKSGKDVINAETFRFAPQIDEVQSLCLMYVLVHNTMIETPSFFCLCFIQIEAIVSQLQPCL